MLKKITLFFATCMIGFSQSPPLPYQLYTQPFYSVPQKFSGSGSPGLIKGSLPGDWYYDTAAIPPVAYFCSAPQNSVPPACTSVTSGQWQQSGASTNGTNGQVLTSNGSGSFGTPLSVQGNTSTVLLSGTVATNKTLCTDANGNATTTSCPGGGFAIYPGSLCASAGCVLNETANWTNAVMVAGTIQACGVVATTAPTGSTVIVDVLLNGTSIFGGNPKTTVALNSTAYSEVTTFATSSVNKGDLVVFKVTQVDSNSIAQFVRASCRVQ